MQGAAVEHLGDAQVEPSGNCAITNGKPQFPLGI